MQEKPKLSLAQIINMSVGFMGIQMGFGLQNGNASAILTNFGADVHELSWFWLVAPLTGLLVQPLIGYFGDNTWTFMGRRKPYFLAGAILAALGLIFLPNSSIIAGESMKATEFMGISAILWLSILFLALMDASFNISMEPFRALVGDLLPKSQGTLGFSIQTILIGLGAVIGSAMPSILKSFGFNDVAPAGRVAENVVASFYVGALILLATIIYTIVTTKEYPPEEFEKYHEKEEGETEKRSIWNIVTDFKKMPKLMMQLGAVQFFSWFALFTMWVYTTTGITQNTFNISVNENYFQEAKKALSIIPIEAEEKKIVEKALKDLDNTSIENGTAMLPQNVAAYLGNNHLVPEKELYEYCQNVLQNDDSKDGKEHLSKLEAAMQSKKAEEHMVSYPILSNVMQKKPVDQYQMVLEMKRVNQAYSDGGEATRTTFSWYNFWAIPFAFVLIPFAKKTSRKFVHSIALFCGGLGLISMFFVSNPAYFRLSAVGIGFAWASILAMPYAMLIDAIPAKKMGVYMGIFNFFIVIPQIINGIFGGPIILHFFHNHAIYYVSIGGICMIVASVLTLLIPGPVFGESQKLEKA